MKLSLTEWDCIAAAPCVIWQINILRQALSNISLSTDKYYILIIIISQSLFRAKTE